MYADSTRNEAICQVLESESPSLIADLTAYFRRRLKDWQSAEDAVSETMMILWRKRESVRQDSELRLFAYGIARNVLKNQQRTERRLVRLNDAVTQNLREEPPRSDPRADDLRDALLSLNERDREIVMLVAWDGLSGEEAGAVLGMTANAIRVRYHRARTKLKKYLSTRDK